MHSFLFSWTKSCRLTVAACDRLIPCWRPPPSADSPVDRTHKLIETFKSVKAPPEGGKLSAADEAANAKVFGALDGFFDFATFSADCLGPAAGKLSAVQAKEAKERLIHILRKRGYPNGGAVFNDGIVKEGKPVDRDKGTAVPLTVSFPKQDLSMEVAFVWNRAGRSSIRCSTAIRFPRTPATRSAASSPREAPKTCCVV